MPETATLAWDTPTETVVPGHHSGSADAALIAWDTAVKTSVPNNHTGVALPMSWDDIA